MSTLLLRHLSHLTDISHSIRLRAIHTNVTLIEHLTHSIDMTPIARTPHTASTRLPSYTIYTQHRYDSHRAYPTYSIEMTPIAHASHTASTRLPPRMPYTRREYDSHLACLTHSINTTPITYASHTALTRLKGGFPSVVIEAMGCEWMCDRSRCGGNVKPIVKNIYTCLQ